MSGRPSLGANPRIALENQQKQAQEDYHKRQNNLAEKKKQEEYEREKTQPKPPNDDTGVLSVSWYKERSFPYNDAQLETEVLKEIIEQPEVRCGTPVFERFGQGVIPEAFANDWPLPPNLRHKAFPEPLAKDDKKRRRGRGSRRLKGEEAPVFQEKKSSKVGVNHQVSSLPAVGNAAEDPGGEVLWDPIAADRARASGINIDQYINSNSKMAFPAKMLTIQSLHLSKYDTAGALSNFISLVNEVKDKTRGGDPLDIVSEEDRRNIERLFTGQTTVKDIKAIAKATNQNIDSVLVQYYRWKGAHSGGYKATKRKRRQSKGNDYCEICDDGGVLIECELCRKAYHPECLDPPLEKIPDEEWYCESCMLKSPARVRSLHRQQSSSAEVPSPRSKTARPASVRNVRRKSTPDPYLYEVSIPISSFGSLHISVGEHKGSGNIVFSQYNRAPDGSMGYAEENQVFKSPGDTIVAINHSNIEGMRWKSFAPLVSLAIADCRLRKTAVRFRMRHVPKAAKSPSSGRAQNGNGAHPTARSHNGKSNAQSQHPPLPQIIPRFHPNQAMMRPYGIPPQQGGPYPVNGVPPRSAFQPAGVRPLNGSHPLPVAAHENLHRASMNRLESGAALQRAKPRLPSEPPPVAPKPAPAAPKPVVANGTAQGQSIPSRSQNVSDEERTVQGNPPGCRIEYIESEKSNGCAKDDNEGKRVPPIFLQYTVRVPVTHEGLRLVLDEVDDFPCVIGYRTFSNGEPSPCMKMNPRPFKRKDDQILAIDNVPLQNKNYDDVIDILMDNKDKRVRVFRMRTRKEMC